MQYLRTLYYYIYMHNYYKVPKFVNLIIVYIYKAHAKPKKIYICNPLAKVPTQK